MRLLKNQKNTTNKASSGLMSRGAVGVDISQKTIKMVQLTGRSLNQIQLEKYVITKLPKNIIRGNQIQDYDQLVSYLQHAYTQLNTTGKNIVAAMPQSLVTVETAVHPRDSELDLDAFVENEISQLGSIEEMNYDYQVVGNSVMPLGRQVLLVAVRKDDIEPRIEAFESANLTPAFMDVDLFAQSNAFSFWINQHAPELTDEKIAVIDVGDFQMQALVLQKGQILYKQETPVSSEQLLQLIQRTYQVTEEEAENMRSSVESRPLDYQSQISDRFNIQVAQEVQRVLQFYYTTQASDQFSSVKHIFLTGSASLQEGLPETVFSQTNTATQCVSPIIYATHGKRVDLSQLQQDAASLTTAFGLALRGL
ncbi:MAG: type IV pilus assembly protein PilM [Neisseria sp.]|uniref:type IV pilus assembly protein PilM n=1 Tax=Neisseria sp. TaxID=192066 RepID=UPI0026DC18F4|nr:type IV pilus assembly protein PilM [Neisseria sp.]MDO4640907.1 type IV pilus assembly protein PilM [Neisseria sp.]